MQTLLILPGWGGNKKTWEGFLEHAKKDFKVIVLELPCFGEKPCPTEIWGVEDYAKYSYEEIKKKNISNPIILGHSFGGAVAVRLVTKYLNNTRHLILTAPAISRPKKYIRRLMFLVFAKFGKIIFKLPILEKFDLWAKRVLYRAADSPDYNRTAGIKRDIFKKIVRESVESDLEKIRAKTLLIWGSKDGYVPVRFAHRAKRLIPNSSLVIIKKARHGLHIQKPVRVLEEVKKFVFENK